MDFIKNLNMESAFVESIYQTIQQNFMQKSTAQKISRNQIKENDSVEEALKKWKHTSQKQPIKLTTRLVLHRYDQSKVRLKDVPDILSQNKIPKKIEN